MVGPGPGSGNAGRRAKIQSPDHAPRLSRIPKSSKRSVWRACRMYGSIASDAAGGGAV